MLSLLSAQLDRDAPFNARVCWCRKTNKYLVNHYILYIALSWFVVGGFHKRCVFSEAGCDSVNRLGGPMGPVGPGPLLYTI